VRKIKKGKNCVFWSNSGKKQFFPYSYNSIFGFFESRSSTFIKNYFSKGFNLFNSAFYKDYRILKNYNSEPDVKKIFQSIYSERLIRPFTTYSKDLDIFENPEFLNFYFDNYGYLFIKSIISKIKDYIKLNEIYYLCSEEKLSCINPFSFSEKSIISNELNTIALNRFNSFEKILGLIDKKNKGIYIIETYPYWFSIEQIKRIEDYYLYNKDDIENINSANQPLFNFYFEKYYSSLNNNSKIIERFTLIQKTWIYLINLIKQNGNFVVLDGSFSDFRVYPFLSGFLPQKRANQQIFDIYLFGDNLSLGIGKNIYIVNKENIGNIKISEINQQPYFNPFGIDLIFSNLRRIISTYNYTVLLRYLKLILSRKDCDVIGPYIYEKNTDEKTLDKDRNKPYVFPIKIPEEIFNFLLRLLPDKKNH